MKSSYITQFTDRKHIEEAYGCKLPKGARVWIAWYGYGSYSGYSFVLYKVDGKLYEVNGSHCSCYGLEGQWQPEETTAKALRKRRFDVNRYEGAGEAQKALRDVLNKIDKAEKREARAAARKKAQAEALKAAVKANVR